MVFIGSVNAQSYSIDGLSSGTTRLSGSSAGNIQSFDVDLNLSSLPKNLVISSATLQFNTSGTSGIGDVRILDKYKSSATNVIDIISLNNSGLKATAAILTNVNEWYANSFLNYGVSFVSKDFSATDNVIFSNIKLLVETSEKDTTPPVITKQDRSIGDLNVYKFLIETDEATKIVINIGKTSIYDQKGSSEVTFATSHEISFSSLQNGVTYHFQIVATDASGNQTKTADATFLTNVTFQTQTGSYVQDSTLFPPNNLSNEIAKKSGKYAVILYWTPSINEDFDGYIVFRKSSDSYNYTELTKLGAKALSYQDDTVESGIKYDYVINSYKTNKISFDGAKTSVEIPADATALDSAEKPQTTYNTGQVLLIIFAVAVMVYIIVYLIIKFVPRLLIKKPLKGSLKNVLHDPSFYENTVTSEFGSKTEIDYPLDDPVPGRDMN